MHEAHQDSVTVRFVLYRERCALYKERCVLTLAALSSATSDIEAPSQGPWIVPDVAFLIWISARCMSITRTLHLIYPRRPPVKHAKWHRLFFYVYTVHCRQLQQEDPP